MSGPKLLPCAPRPLGTWRALSHIWEGGEVQLEFSGSSLAFYCCMIVMNLWSRLVQLPCLAATGHQVVPLAHLWARGLTGRTSLRNTLAGSNRAVSSKTGRVMPEGPSSAMQPGPRREKPGDATAPCPIPGDCHHPLACAVGSTPLRLLTSRTAFFSGVKNTVT